MIVILVCAVQAQNCGGGGACVLSWGPRVPMLLHDSTASTRVTGQDVTAGSCVSNVPFTKQPFERVFISSNQQLNALDHGKPSSHPQPN